MAEQIDQLLTRLPEARHVSFEPAVRDGATEGARLAFHEPYEVRYDLTKADVIVALDADFLSCGPGHLQNASQWAARRRPGAGNPPMSRVYAIEPTPTGSGMVADHRLIVSAAQVEQVARLLARNLEAIEESGSGELPGPQAKWVTRWVAALANDLRGKPSAVIVGEGQPPAVHVLGHAINAKLGNLGKTVLLTAPETTKSRHGLAAMAELAEEMDQGKVETLLIVDANPVYATPADLDFVNRLKKVPLRIHLGHYNDETAEYCDWHIPQAHFLESWGDGRSEDGTVSIVQPLIAPLFNGTSPYELLAIMLEDAPRNGHAIVRDYWEQQWSRRDAATRGQFEAFWNKALHDGFIAGTARKPAEGLTLKAGWADRIKSEKPTPGDFEIIFRSDSTILDGRFANNGWLQELPKPVTKITWDNAIFVSPNDAVKLGLRNREGPHGGAHGDGVVNLVELTYRGKTITAPAWMMPGQADGSITVQFGYGRSRAGKLGSNIGYNAYSLWHSAAPYFSNDATLRRTGGTYTLASTQVHHSMAAMEASAQAEARHIIRHATLEEYKNRSAFRVGRGTREEGTRPRARRASIAADPLSGRVEIRRLQVGHVHRHRCVHGLQRLCRRLPIREQHPRRGQNRSGARPRNALAPHRPLLHGARECSNARLFPATDLYALRERPLRAGLPRRSDHAQHRWHQ
jgi:molybdopterin-containing oxidoreductase family iron-sulfur binding subunit